MLILRLDEETVVVTGLNLALCKLIQQIPACAEIDDDAARERLYSSPSEGAMPELDSDWKSFVEPDLRQLFQSSVEVVKEDLAEFPPSEAELFYTLQIPFKHLANWINVLNQARLALGAHYAITEQDMENEPETHDDRSHAIVRIHIYGELQARFLRVLDGV